MTTIVLFGMLLAFAVGALIVYEVQHKLVK